MKLTEEGVYHLIQELEENIEIQQKSAERCLKKGDSVNYTYYQGLCDGIKASIHYLKLYLLIDDNTPKSLRKSAISTRRATVRKKVTSKTTRRTMKQKN